MLNMRKKAEFADIIKNIVDFLIDAQHFVEGRVPEESMDAALSDALLKWLTRFQGGLIDAGQNTDSMKEILHEVTQQLNLQNIFIDILPVETYIDETFPEPPREQTSKRPPMTPEESKFVNEHTSDEIWKIVNDPNFVGTPEQELAKSVITKGIIANKLNLRKQSWDNGNYSQDYYPGSNTAGPVDRTVPKAPRDNPRNDQHDYFTPSQIDREYGENPHSMQPGNKGNEDLKAPDDDPWGESNYLRPFKGLVPLENIPHDFNIGFDTDYTQRQFGNVHNFKRQILSYIHTARQYTFAARAIANKFDSASLQTSDISEELISVIRDIQKDIPKDKLYNGEDDDWVKNGIQKKIHLTILFGVKDAAAEQAKEIFKEFKTTPIKTKGLKYFDNDDYTVVVVECTSKDLQKLHKDLADSIENKNTHKDYIPHVTIAYLQPGERIDAKIPEIEWTINTFEISTTDAKLKRLAKLDWNSLTFGPLKKEDIQSTSPTIKNTEWQEFRKSLKGLSNEEKYKQLKKWLHDHNNSEQAKIQVTNYVNALKRGGQVSAALALPIRKSLDYSYSWKKSAGLQLTQKGQLLYEQLLDNPDMKIPSQYGNTEILGTALDWVEQNPGATTSDLSQMWSEYANYQSAFIGEDVGTEERTYFDSQVLPILQQLIKDGYVIQTFAKSTAVQKKKETSKTKEFDGKEYKKCTGWGLSGSIAAAFEVIKRDGDTWVPASRYDELKKAMKDIEKDLKKGSILDRPREELDPAIWQTDPEKPDSLPMLKPDIRTHIATNFFDYISEFGGYSNPQLWIKNMFYTGSTATYKYQDKSDIDIHIIVDWKDMLKENPQKVKNDLETVWRDLHDTFWWTLNQKKLPGTKHPLTYYVVKPGDEKSVIEQKEEIYDIGHNVWLIPPSKQPVIIPEEALAIAIEEASKITTRIETYLADARKNAIDYEMLELLQQMTPKTVPTLLQQLNQKRSQLDEELVKLKDEYALLKQKRQEAFDNGKPIVPSESKNFTMGNIIFKLVERYKLMDILRQIKRITDAQPLKFNQVTEIVKALGLEENS